MKRTILAALALFPLVASAREISAGVFQLKGDSTIGYTSGTNELKFSNGTKDKTDTTELSAGLQGLYYLAPGIGVGAVVSYSDATSKSGSDKDTTTALLIGPAVGLDYSLTPQVGLFAEGALGFASMNVKQTGPNAVFTQGDLKLSGWGVEATAGVKFFLERHFSFDVGLAYRYLSMKSTQEVYLKPTNTISNVGVNLGVSVYFGGK